MPWKILIALGAVLFLYSIGVILSLPYATLNEYGQGYLLGHILRAVLGFGLVVLGYLRLRRRAGKE